MTKDGALKLALEALMEHCGNYMLDSDGVKMHIAACNAIDEALAQPEPELVATTRPCRSCHGTGERFTGIYESPTAICKPCLGTGTITNSAAPEERNFCPRCGKRRGGDVNDIHTCTPP